MGCAIEGWLSDGHDRHESVKVTSQHCFASRMLAALMAAVGAPPSSGSAVSHTMLDWRPVRDNDQPAPRARSRSTGRAP